MANRPAPRANTVRQGVAFTPRVKVPQKLNPTKKSDVTFSKPPGMPECFVMLVAYEGRSSQLTLHRPIGITQLSADDWVSTESSDVIHLLERKDNPDAPVLNRKIREKTLRLAIDAKIFKEGDDGKIFYPEDGKKTRTTYLTEARQRVQFLSGKKSKPTQNPVGLESKDTPDGKSTTETSSSSSTSRTSSWGDESENQGPNQALDFKTLLPPFAQRAEVAFLELKSKPETLQVLAGFQKKLDEYQTRSGPLADRDQVPVPYLAGKSRDQAIDVITKMVMRGPSAS